MTQQDQTAKPKTRRQKLARGLFIVSASLLVLLFAAQTIWKFSGSNQWRLIGERRGVKVYALKAPGDSLEQVRGVTRIRSTLAGMVKMAQDPDVCDRVGCTESRLLERVDDQLVYSTFRYDSPWPFRPREFVVRAQFYQNPLTKELTIEYAATPEKLPPNDCCVRVTRMNNMWFVKPVGNGEIEIDYRLNMDLNGFVPEVMFNEQRKQMLFKLMPYIQKVVNKPKYQQAKFAFLKE